MGKTRKENKVGRGGSFHTIHLHGLAGEGISRQSPARGTSEKLEPLR